MNSGHASSDSIRPAEAAKLEELKSRRYRIFAPGSSFADLVHRRLQTWNSGLPKRELLKHLLHLLRKDIALRLSVSRVDSKIPIPAGEGSVFTARIAGGLGDMILASRFLLRFSELHDLDFVVEHHSPKMAAFALRACPHFKAASSTSFDHADVRCMASLHIGHLVEATYVNPRAGSVLRTHLDQAAGFLDSYSTFVAASPFLDGLLGDALAADGIKRHTSCLTQFDMNYTDEDYLRPPQHAIDQVIAPLGLTPQRYITIADGWDVNFGFLNGRRATKALRPDFLANLVSALQAQRPDIAIIQIGDQQSGTDIPGISMNLRGRTSLSEASMLLAGARLHMDAEGGLVHLARAVGTPSAVFFGPTNPEYFAYQGNLAFVPDNQCMGCSWTTNTWMAICPLGKSTICMDSHSLPQAINHIVSLLDSTDSTEPDPS